MKTEKKVKNKRTCKKGRRSVGARRGWFLHRCAVIFPEPVGANSGTPRVNSEMHVDVAAYKSVVTSSVTTCAVANCSGAINTQAPPRVGPLYEPSLRKYKKNVKKLKKKKTHTTHVHQPLGGPKVNKPKAVLDVFECAVS